ncbi:hypothetical protein [Rhodoferax sp.]|uniref:hypothetical protein n=1 Tax=Rhodoferax sp. TaxID=50421 RepID=UPI002ACE166C|nr:hypothetical protein [Rhodoferax sp.]MDZ7921690.1 hypothetical protein [Rhodoferax sp.]
MGTQDPIEQQRNVLAGGYGFTSSSLASPSTKWPCYRGYFRATVQINIGTSQRKCGGATTRVIESQWLHSQNKKIHKAGDEMNTEEQAQIFQTNFANEQRNAAHDYWEVHAQNNIKFALTTWSPKKLDETAIENPRFFKARFGFDACTIVRIIVIAFQRKFDLLDP